MGHKQQADIQMQPKFLESLVQAAAAQGGTQSGKEDQGGHPMLTKWATCAQQKAVEGAASQEKIWQGVRTASSQRSHPTRSMQGCTNGMCQWNAGR